ncbi:MAG: hypothetical protein RPR97_12575 [Colwellia sp.]
MSRKEGSFSQLYEYMEKGASRQDDKFRFTYNFFGRKKEQILNEFSNNAEQLKYRENGVYLYHEIISISRSKTLSDDEQKKALYEIVQEYTKRRAFGNLACGYMHDEKDNNLHFHLMISSNEVNKSNRVSLRKKEFSTLKVEMEKWVLQKYPELKQEKIISKKSQYKDQKEEFKDSLQSILSTAKSREDLHKLLENNQASYKIRGKTITFTNGKTGKKHRLNTLGLGGEYALMEARFEGKQDIFERVKKASKQASDEWLFGDFSEREKKATKEKYRKQNVRDKKVKPEKDQTFTEKAQESASEWVFGDFSARESRARQKKSEENLKKWRDNQEGKTDGFVLDKDHQTPLENTIEATNEWLFGDFTNRNNREVKRKAEENLKKMRKQKESSKQKDKSKTKENGGKKM